MRMVLKAICVSVLIHCALYGFIMYLSYKNAVESLSRTVRYEWERWDPMIPFKTLGLAIIVGTVIGLIIGVIIYACSDELTIKRLEKTA